MKLLIMSLLVLGCRSAASDLPQRAPEGIVTLGSGTPAIRYLVLGDSTAVSVGGTYDRGIAMMTARHLAERRSVEMLNLAVSGARIRDVLHEQLPRIGAFIPDVVLLDAGANDVIRLTGARSLGRDLNEIARRLRTINPDVLIVVTGAADMTTPPRIPWVLRPLAGARTRALNRVFIEESARLGLTFAPIARETGPLFRADPSLFSADRFHPDDRGYSTWITVINRALDEATKRSLRQ